MLKRRRQAVVEHAITWPDQPVVSVRPCYTEVNVMSQTDNFSILSISVHHIKFYEALDLSGKPIVVQLGGANCAYGPEATGVAKDASGSEVYEYLPVLFHLPDGRLFYARYTREGYRHFHCPLENSRTGVTLRQLSEGSAMGQCEMEKIPFPPRPTGGGEPSSTRSALLADRLAGTPNSPAESAAQRENLVMPASQADDSPAGRERRVADYLEKNQNATSKAVHEATGIPETTIRNMPIWKEHQAKKKTRQKGGSVKAVPLTEEMLDSLTSRDRHPSEIVEENDSFERFNEKKEFHEAQIPGASDPKERAAYHRMEADEQLSTLWIWLNESRSRVD